MMHELMVFSYFPPMEMPFRSRLLSFVNEFKLLFHLDVVEILSTEHVPFIFALQQHIGAANQQPAAGNHKLSLDIYVTFTLYTIILAWSERNLMMYTVTLFYFSRIPVCWHPFGGFVNTTSSKAEMMLA